MKKVQLLLLMALIISSNLFSQLDTLPTNLVQYYEDNGFIYFNPNTLDEQKLFVDYKYAFFKKYADDMILKKTWVDKQLNLKHNRFQQIYGGVEVEGCEFTEHLDSNNFVIAANGKICSEIYKKQPEGWMHEENALNYLIEYLDGDSFSWYYPEWETQFQIDVDDSTATSYPIGEKLFALNNFQNIQFDIPEENYTPAWRFVIKSISPSYYKEFFVNALTGDVFREKSLTRENTTANITGFGNASIDSRWYGGLVNGHILHTDNNDRNIMTKHSSNAAWWTIPFISNGSNAFWNSNENAVQVHWSLSKAFDFFKTNFNRIGMQDNNSILRVKVQENQNSTVQYDASYYHYNEDNIRIGYMPGTNIFMGSLDILAHEYTHGITEHTAGLEYEGESGALNESFSDIFGVTIRNEVFITPNNWFTGNGIVSNPRRIDSPNQGGEHYDASCSELNGQPDTYHGGNWQYNSCDYSGVHVNSGVQNHWFYILSQGKIGVNDNGDSYNITGIGTNDAIKITYYNLTNFMQEFSTYQDAKSAGTLSSILLFGQCSNQAIETNKAWHAVGLGNIVDCETLGITNNSENNYNIYPNPANNYIVIDFNDDNKKLIKIYDINGKLIKQVYSSNKKTRIDISSLSEGLYILNINNDSVNKSYKLLKN